MNRSDVSPTIDFDREGAQQGFLKVPYSTNESAYGWLPVPVVCVKGGEGPSVLLVAGNHGDEYEGQLALTKLCRRLRPENVRGRIIVLPTLNCPAAVAGRRLSPIDNGNLNRSFPGSPNGSPTSILAHYIEEVLLGEADYVVDLHSGGRSLRYVPCALIRRYDDAGRMQRARRAIEVFGAPISIIKDKPQGGERTLLGAADRKGVHYLGTELSGGGDLCRAALAIAENGVARFLMETGALVEPMTHEPARRTELFEVAGDDYYVYALESGVFEPAVDLGDEVDAGASAGLIHYPETPWREPAPVVVGHAGRVVCVRTLARTERGDCLFHVATPLNGA